MATLRTRELTKSFSGRTVVRGVSLEIASGEVGATRGLVLHAVDAVGVVHAMLLRIQALVLPIQTLVFGGH